MELTLWTYEGPPHVGAIRIAASMRHVHLVLHAPQGDTYADLLFTMIEREGRRPPVTWTTFQARDLGSSTAEMVIETLKGACERYQPQVLMVAESCTGELIQDQPGALAKGAGLSAPVIPIEMAAYTRKENWGAAETFYQIVRHLADTAVRPLPREGRRPLVNLLGPAALGFRHRDDIREVRRILDLLGIDVHLVAPLGASPADIRTIGAADFNIVLYPEIGDEAARWLDRTFAQPAIRTVPPWHDNPTYISALANSVRTAVAEHGKPDALVISFHGIPKRYHMSGDPYHCHCMKTARLLREELGWDKESFHATFQSRFGSEPWLMPYTDEAVTEMAEDGHKHVMVLAPGFVADCLETLDELGNELEEEFHEAGGETLTYIPCLNDSDDGMKVIEELAAANLAGWVDVAPRPAAKAPKPKAVKMKKAG